MPLPDVRSGEDISPAERAKLDKEVESYAQEMEAFWKAKADARDWDPVRANLEVYALAGEKVTEDPRRTEAYRDLVWEGLKVEPGPTRPGLTAADVAAIKEVVRRKAAGFWGGRHYQDYGPEVCPRLYPYRSARLLSASTP